MQIRLPPCKKCINIWISFGNFVELTTAMSVSEVVPAIANQIIVGSVTLNIVSPCCTKRRVAIATSKLTGTIESNFQRKEVNVEIGGCISSLI